GISLTVNRCTAGSFLCRVIPHTYENTNLKHKRPGDLMNIEIDMLARYVVNIIEKTNKTGSELSVNELKQAGF
ncbi:MAG: riboflavin synthase, partial [bacterium]